jgi:hypothetical protein
VGNRIRICGPSVSAGCFGGGSIPDRMIPGDSNRESTHPCSEKRHPSVSRRWHGHPTSITGSQGAGGNLSVSPAEADPCSVLLRGSQAEGGLGEVGRASAKTPAIAAAGRGTAARRVPRDRARRAPPMSIDGTGQGWSRRPAVPRSPRPGLRSRRTAGTSRCA